MKVMNENCTDNMTAVISKSKGFPLLIKSKVRIFPLCPLNTTLENLAGLGKNIK